MNSARGAQSRPDTFRFLKGWLREPLAVGALFPTSRTTADRMASVVEPSSKLPVLELGAGTGVITDAILRRGVAPRQLYSVEYDRAFADYLRGCFPQVNVLRGDAFALDRTLPADQVGKFDCVISAIPLFSFPMEKRLSFVSGLFSRLAPGRPIVQITHGLKSPVPVGTPGIDVEKFAVVLRNVPPAHLWLYRPG